MTAPTTVDAAAEPSGPIDDDLLAQALTARAESNSSLGLLPDEPDEPEVDIPAPVEDAPADPLAASETETDALPTDPEPDAAADPLADQPDPWTTLAKDAAPLAYKMNGQPHAFDSILEVPGKGGIIPADRLDEVRNLVARYESNAAATKDLHAYKQQVEALGGVDTFHKEMERTKATDAASVLILEALFQNPRQFVNDDGSPNRERINFLVERAGIAAERAKFAYQSDRGTAERTLAQSTQDAQVMESAIPNAVASFRESFPTLTDDDYAAAAKHFNNFTSSLVYKATPEDAQKYGFAVGTPLVDRNKMVAWFEDRAEQRAAQVQREAEAKTQQAAREKAAKENAARTTRPPVKKPVARPRNEDGTFAESPRLDASTIFERALSGTRIKDGQQHFSDE